ncbi:hypothetical protein ES705_45631 [subsurface metagenome]
MAETFTWLLTRQGKLESIAETRRLAEAIPVLFKPKSVESDGAAPVKLKFIESDEDNRVKLKSIR